MSHLLHEQAAAAQRRRLRCAVLTLSDTRTVETDGSGAIIRERLLARGDEIGWYGVMAEDYWQVQSQLHDLTSGQYDLVITNGGTGISQRDTTYEVVEKMLDRRLPGFGELFRQLSYTEIGPAAMLSRAVAGMVLNTFIFCLPGSTNAVQLAMERLILPNLDHMNWERNR